MGRQKTFANYNPEFSGKLPKSVSITGKTFLVNNWRAVLLETCAFVHAKKPAEFHRILNLRGNRRPWFSRKPSDLRSPVRIEGTDIYAEVNSNANALVLRCFQVLRHFGFELSLNIELVDQR